MFGLFSKKGKEVKSASNVGQLPGDSGSRRVLVIDSSKDNDWYKVFSGATLKDETKVEVEQAGWEALSMTSYSQSRTKIVCTLNIARRPLPNTNQNRVRTFKPDIVLIRNEVRGIKKLEDYKNILIGLKYAGLDAINSFDATLGFMDRPWVHAELNRIHEKLGHDEFPLIDQTYYPVAQEMIIAPQFPVVVKLGHAHAGYGKMKIRDHHDFADFKSVVALTDMYCTAEPYIEGEYDLRIQVVGPSVKVYKRQSAAGNWKTNTGTSVIEEIPLTEQYTKWVDECRKMFGGIEIFAIDALHSLADGKEYIIEVNGSSIGLAPDCEAELDIMRDMILEKLNDKFCPDP